MIVTARLAGEFVDTRADGGRLDEAHHVVDLQDFPGRNTSSVHRRVMIGVYVQDVIEDRALAGEIPVGVVGEVYRGRLVGGGEVVDSQFVIVGERVGDLHLQAAGVTFLAVRARVAEGNRRAGLAPAHAGGPNFFVDSLGAAMQMIGIVVDGQGVFLPVENELALGDAVGHPTGCHAKVRVAVEIAFKVIVAQHDVAQCAVFVRHMHLGEHRPVGDDSGLEAVFVDQRVGFDCFAVLGFSECFFFHRTLVFFLRSGCRRFGRRTGEEQSCRHACHCFFHIICALIRQAQPGVEHRNFYVAARPVSMAFTARHDEIGQEPGQA